MYSWASSHSEAVLNSKGLKILLDYPTDYKFDLIIYDITLTPNLSLLIKRFNNPPVVAVTPFLLPGYLSYSFGNSLHTSFIPHFSVKYSNVMTFSERVYNFLATYMDRIVREYYFLRNENNRMAEYFPKWAGSVWGFERNITLLLSNSDPILTYPVPVPPNIVEVGGLHIKPPKPLPKVREIFFLRHPAIRT